MSIPDGRHASAIHVIIPDTVIKTDEDVLIRDAYRVWFQMTLFT
jgi:hypothetical protein